MSVLSGLALCLHSVSTRAQDPVHTPFEADEHASDKVSDADASLTDIENGYVDADASLVDAVVFDPSGPSGAGGGRFRPIAPANEAGEAEEDPLSLPRQPEFRPGTRDPSARFQQPFRGTAGYLIKGLNLWIDTGAGYDSNARLSRDEDDTMVTWFDFGGNWDGDLSLGDGDFFFYGINVGGALFSFGSDDARSSSASFDPSLNPYVGLRGRKTLLRLDGYYDLFEGNDYFYDQNNRESRASEGQSTSYRLSGTRLFKRGTLEGVADYTMQEFDDNRALNDQDSWLVDLGYYHNPHRMPKTDIGGGVRFGEYITSRNPDLFFYEPSLRFRHRQTLKSSLDGRLGYMFREYSGANAGGNRGDITLALGGDWRATERMTFRVEGYREYRTSLVSIGEDFEVTGASLSWRYRLPWWRMHFNATGAWEKADYESNTILPGSGRDDDYFRFSADLSRPIDIFSWMDSSLSLFMNYRENASSEGFNDFSQTFTGVRLRGSF